MKGLALALALLLAVPATAAASPPRDRKKPNLRYVISGAVVFGVFYTLALALAIRAEEGELAVPILGPLIDLRRCRECTGSPVEQGVVAGLVLDAALQAAGASLFISGFVLERRF
jgi:hypothetical protein